MIEILDSFMRPVLGLEPLYAIALIAFILTLLATLAYKFTTDQHLMKSLKEEMKKIQEEIKQFKEDPKKVMEINARAMETNMKYFMHSMRPMIITIVPFFFVYLWLAGHFAYAPIMPGETFTAAAVFDKGASGKITINVPEGIELISSKTQTIKDNSASWDMKGEQGEYLIEYKYNNVTYKQEVLITTSQEYKEPVQKIENSKLKILQLNNEKITPLNLFGWRIGWFGTYFIFSIIFNMILRKTFKLH